MEGGSVTRTFVSKRLLLGFNGGERCTNLEVIMKSNLPRFVGAKHFIIVYRIRPPR